MSPQTSLPHQCGSWSDLKAAYRLLSNQAIDPQSIQQPHRKYTREICADHPVILCVQDDTRLAFNSRTKVKGLGKLNDLGQGMIQHTTLALCPDGKLQGVLDQFWFNRVDAPESETRHQRRARWRESDAWIDAVGNVGAGSKSTRFVHIMDRAGDSLEVIEACEDVGVGFVIRARHDRRVAGGSDKLWSWMARQPVRGKMNVKVSAQRDDHGRVTRLARNTQVSIRFGRVQLEPPWNHPGPGRSRWVWAVYLRENKPPKGIEPIDWMLLTSEPVSDHADAKRIIKWYQHRWVIEEWHRVEKEGCRLESSQLDDALDLQRLAAIIAVISVRMLQLRDLAGFEQEDSVTAGEGSRIIQADDPCALQASVPRMWIIIVGALAKVEVTRLTPRQFWLTIAKRGGWIGRKRDGRPGWKVIWRGWYDINMMVEGVELHSESKTKPRNCG
jgi:hypothetical protein